MRDYASQPALRRGVTPGSLVELLRPRPFFQLLLLSFNIPEVASEGTYGGFETWTEGFG